MRIAMVNTVCRGSHGRVMADLRQAAARAGHASLIAYGRGEALDGEVLRIGGQIDVLAHVALTRALDRHALGSLGATRRFVAALDAWQPDLLHLHNVHGYYLHAPTLFAYIRQRGLPTIWTHHDCWALTGHCSHFLRAGCDRWQTGCHHCLQKKEYPASYGLDASRSNWQWKRDAFSGIPSLRIVTPSLWLDGVLAKSYLQNTPREVIPNGVDLTLFTPGDDDMASIRVQHRVPEGQAMLLAVAAPFDERKGFADAVQLAQRLSGKARLVMVGLDEKQLAALPDTVCGIARTDGPEALVALYRAADCLVNPTKEDTYPTVNMEAMACGTPVAGYGVGGATEQLSSPGALAVQVGDVAGLAEAAMALAGNRAALRGVCRTWANDHFDRRVALDAYMALYERIMEETSA